MESEQGLTQEVNMLASGSSDPPERSDLECNMYGENNGTFSNYNARKMKTRCYICGDRDHEGQRCKKVTDCFICSKKGHLVVNCPNKNVKVDLASRLCLKCGSTGHDMFSCVSNYDSEDLKAIECYICGKTGHLCCAGDRTILIGASCYNCGQAGHFGWECTTRKGRRARKLNTANTTPIVNPDPNKPNNPNPNNPAKPWRICNGITKTTPEVQVNYMLFENDQKPLENQVKTAAERTTKRRAKRKARRDLKLNTANTTPIVNPNPNNPKPNSPKQVTTSAEKTTERRVKRKAHKLNTANTAPIVNPSPNSPKRVKTAAEKTTERSAKRKARRARKLNAANTTPIVNPNPDMPNNPNPNMPNNPNPNMPNNPNPNSPKQVKTAAEKTTERRVKREARRSRKLDTANTRPTVNLNPNKPNGWSLLPIAGSYYGQPGSTTWIPPPASNNPGPSHSHQHINYQLGTQVPNSFGPPTQSPHHFYPNFQNRPQITRIPFNHEIRNMAPPMGPGPSHSHQQHINYQFGTQVPNSFDPPTQFPHHFYPNFQNRPQITRIPFNQETRNMAHPGPEIRRPMVQPPVPTHFSHVIQNDSRQPFSHQLPWTESHVPLNSSAFPTRFPRVIQNNPRQPFIHQNVIERPFMGSHNPQPYPPRPGWNF